MEFIKESSNNITQVINYINSKVLELNLKNKYNKEIYYYNLNEFLNSYEKIHILSKGGNYNYTEEENNTVYIGIKQSICQLSRPDILVMNDYEGLFGIEDLIFKVKFIICPYLIHYKHQPSDLGHEKFLSYLEVNNFKGDLIYFIIGDRNNPDNKYHIYKEPILDSAEVIFEFLTLANVHDKKIKIDGLYETIEDNLKINERILNSKEKISFEYLEDYNSYLERIIFKKKVQNLDNMRCTSENVTETLQNKRDYIKNRYRKLFDKNYILWSQINNIYNNA